jgi:hypothetical protein
MHEPRFKLLVYKPGEHFTYPDEVREFRGEPELIPLLSGDGVPSEKFDTVSSPGQADFIVYPYRLDPIIALRRTAYARRYMESLPYFPEMEDKHVFFTCHDLGQPLCTSACLITDDPVRSNKDDPYVYTYPHFPMKHVLDASPDWNFGKIRFDINFVGTLSSQVRIDLIAGLTREKRLISFISSPRTRDWADPDTSFLHMADQEKKALLGQMYVRFMRTSWATLCPRGKGSSSIRFFETMCMGRIPVHVSDEYVPPRQDVVEYASFALFVPESEAADAGRIVHAWLSKKDIEERAAMCKKARDAWEAHLAPCHAQDIALDMLLKHKPKISPQAKRTHAFMPGELADEDRRRSYPEHFFDNMEMDDLRLWLKDGLKVEAAPGEPGMLLVNGVPGRFSWEEINTLYKTALDIPPNSCVVEIGSYLGLSSIILATAFIMSKNMNSKIFCIDTWEDGSGLQARGPGQIKDSYGQFLSNVRKAGVDFMLHPIRQDGAPAARNFRDGSVDVLFLNRDHARLDSPGDAVLWLPKIKRGGAIIRKGG